MGIPTCDRFIEPILRSLTGRLDGDGATAVEAPFPRTHANARGQAQRDENAR